MATFTDYLNWAKKNANSTDPATKAKVDEFVNRIKTGQFNDIAKQEGIDLSNHAVNAPPPEMPTPLMSQPTTTANYVPKVGRTAWDIGAGAVKTIASDIGTGLDIASKAGQAIAAPITGQKTPVGLSDIGKGLGVKPDILQPKGKVQEAAGKITQIGEFFLPGGLEKAAIGKMNEAVDVAKFATRFGAKAGTALTNILKTLSTPAATGTSMAGITAAQTRGDTGAVTTAGVTGAIAGGFGKTLETLAPALKQSLSENIGKALGFTGKKTTQQVIDNTKSATSALKIIADNATGATVKDINGIEKPYDPLKATFYETLQAWQIARDKVYSTYDSLAIKAGGEGAAFTTKDFNSVINKIESSAKDATSAFKNKATSIISDIKDNFGATTKSGKITFASTDLKRVQTFLENVNTDVNPASDKAGAKVSGLASQTIRNILDGKIEKATGGGYQAIRNQYADLKSIEQGLNNQTKKIASKVGGWFGSYVEGFGGMDAFLGLLKGSPAEVLRGLGVTGIGVYQKMTRDPERALQKAFHIILKGEQPTIVGKGVSALSKVPVPATRAGLGMFNQPSIDESSKKKDNIPRLEAGQSTISSAGNTGTDDFGKKFVSSNKTTTIGEDSLYDKILASQISPSKSSSQKEDTSFAGTLDKLIRRINIFSDTKEMNNLKKEVYTDVPMTTDFKNTVDKTTVSREKKLSFEGQEDAYTILGIPVGKRLINVDITTPQSAHSTSSRMVMLHEMTHAYLDAKGYSISQDTFNNDWEKAKKTNSTLKNIDTYLASSQDYTDEMDKESITQERFAYASQLFGSGGLSKFPKDLQKHYKNLFK